MVKNPARRTALLNAAIDVLAAQGARGLTFRAVDTEAGVPVGTASNYFTSRDDLLRQAGEYVFVRLTANPEEVADLISSSPSSGRDMEIELMRELLRRAKLDRAGYLAMFELRLEAVRRPELHDTFTREFRNNLDNIVRGHIDSGFPGGRTTAILLYLAMSGLVLEQLTLPKVLDGESDDDLVEALVRTIVPAG